MVSSVGSADGWRRWTTRRHTELGVQALSSLPWETVPGQGGAGLGDLEGVEVEPDLTDVLGDPAHGELAGRGVTGAAHEVGVVDAGGSPAASCEGAADTKPPGTLTHGGSSQSLALSGCVASPICT